MRKKLVSSKCAKCNENVEYFILEDISEELNLNNYNSFKKPLINVCNNCGYINDDLSVDNIFATDKKFNKINENTLQASILNNIKLARLYLLGLIDKNKRIQVLAYILENCKMLLNNFLQDNYTKEDETTLKTLNEFRQNIKNVCLELEPLLNDCAFSNNFYDVLKVEVFCALNKIDMAQEIYKKLKNLSSDLDDEIDDFIRIGGLI